MAVDHSPVTKHNSIEPKQIMLLVLYTKAHQMQIQAQKALGTIAKAFVWALLVRALNLAFNLYFQGKRTLYCRLHPSICFIKFTCNI